MFGFRESVSIERKADQVCILEDQSIVELFAFRIRFYCVIFPVLIILNYTHRDRFC